MKRLVFEVGDHESLILCRVDRLRSSSRKKLHVWTIKSTAVLTRAEVRLAHDPVSLGLRATGEYVHVRVPE